MFVLYGAIYFLNHVGWHQDDPEGYSINKDQFSISFKIPSGVPNSTNEKLAVGFFCLFCLIQVKPNMITKD